MLPENSPLLIPAFVSKHLKKILISVFSCPSFKPSYLVWKHRMETLCPVPSTAFPTPLPCSLRCRGSRYKCNCSNFFHILLGERIFLLLKGISNPLAIPFISSAQWIWKYQPVLALPFTHCHRGAHRAPQERTGASCYCYTHRLSLHGDKANTQQMTVS